MKLAYFGVFLLSVTAFPAAAHRVLTDNNEAVDYQQVKDFDKEGLYCSDRDIGESIAPRTKEGVIVKMKPFVVKQMINKETFKR